MIERWPKPGAPDDGVKIASSIVLPDDAIPIKV